LGWKILHYDIFGILSLAFLNLYNSSENQDKYGKGKMLNDDTGGKLGSTKS
jgi:hypothetical protein